MNQRGNMTGQGMDLVPKGYPNASVKLYVKHTCFHRTLWTIRHFNHPLWEIWSRNVIDKLKHNPCPRCKLEAFGQRVPKHGFGFVMPDNPHISAEVDAR